MAFVRPFMQFDALVILPSRHSFVRAFAILLACIFASQSAGQTDVAAPRILRHPVGQDLVVNDALRLTAEVTGTGPLTFIWSRNGAPLPQNTSELFIEHVSLADAGNYVLTVSNVAGIAISTVTPVAVSAFARPRFIEEPISQSVLYDSPLRLSVAVADNAAPTAFAWFKDGQRLINRDAASLVIEHATPADSGNYTVAATNSGGTTTSGVAEVQVFAPLPPIITRQPQSAVASSSDKITLTVAYTQTGVGPVQIEWRRNGQTLGAHEATLVFTVYDESSYGDYTVTITGAGGTAVSQPARITPRPMLPSWVTIPQDVAVPVGARAVMSVGQVYGTEPILFQWYRNGEAIVGATSLTHVIPQVTSGDYGTYTLQVSNAAGTRPSLPTRLLVPTSPPITIVRQPQSHTLVRSSVASSLLTMQATTTSGALTYEWYHDGFRSNYSTGSTLTADPSPWMVGLYQGVVANGSTRALSDPVILGYAVPDAVTQAMPVATNIRHPNGNVYDQYQLSGSVTTLAANPGKIARISFLDLDGDIVQVEFSGAGVLTLRVVGSIASSAASLYNQPGVQYSKGHVALTIAGADETSHLAVFTVGPLTAVNEALFKPEVHYDGVANLAYVAILSGNGKFGSLRLGNTHFFATLGFTGIYAPDVAFAGPVIVGDIEAHDTAMPLLCVGDAATITLAGGSLHQPNVAPIRMTGLVPLTFTSGTTSHRDFLPMQPNEGRFERGGTDITTAVVP